VRNCRWSWPAGIGAVRRFVGCELFKHRAGLVEWRRRVEAVQHNVIAFQALRPIWRRWAATEVLSGRVATTLDAAMLMKFITPKQQWVDPSKDVQAELDAIAGGLMSRREAVTSRGVDIEALDAEVAADNARVKDLRLTFTAPTKPQTVAVAA
jgi:capsid protein